MSKHTFLIIQFFWMTVICLAPGEIIAQFEEARNMAALFPAEVEGFESDDPLITFERSNDRENLHIEKIYYRTDGSEEIHIELDDFGVNSRFFSRQYNSVKQQADSVGDPDYYYRGYLKQERYDKKVVKKVIYLDKQRILTITHTGTIQNKHMVDEILRQIELDKLIG